MSSEIQRPWQETGLERIRDDMPAEWMAWTVRHTFDTGLWWCARPPWAQASTVKVDDADGTKVRATLDEIWRQHRVHHDVGDPVPPQRGERGVSPCRQPGRSQAVPARMSS
jgi:hypothetical protein